MYTKACIVASAIGLFALSPFIFPRRKDAKPIDGRTGFSGLILVPMWFTSHVFWVGSAVATRMIAQGVYRQLRNMDIGKAVHEYNDWWWVSFVLTLGYPVLALLSPVILVHHLW